MVMDWVKKITDIIMPIETEEEEVETESKPEVVEKKEVKNNVVAKKVATGGGTASYAADTAVTSTSESGTTSIGGMRYTAYSEPTPTARPSLTVVKPHELIVKIYTPENFDQVVGIADDILAKKAAVVNFERVMDSEQRRISDFVNGVCYITDGAVRVISDKIFLYLPAGVEAGEIARVAASMRIR